MTKILLEDTLSFKQATRAAGKPVLLEATANGKLIAHGRFALADVPTANGRVYKRSLWEREIARLKDAMAARRVFGEADHPNDGRTKLTRVACILLNLELTEEGEVIGTSEIVDTTSGKDLRAIVEAGGNIGVSSRGYGSVSKDANGNDVVDDDFQLDTFDFVVDPAQGTAYPDFHTEAKNKPEGTVIKEGAQDNTKPAENSTAPAAPAASNKVTPPSAEEKEEEDAELDGDGKPKVPPQSTPADMQAKIEQAVAQAKAELRAEVTSALLSDPKVAGARHAIESVKTILRPFILDKDVSVALEEKDAKIKALEEQVKALTSQNVKTKVESTALSKAVKDLGFNLYVTKTLAGHPKLESLIASFGDLTLVEDVDALKKLVEPHMSAQKVVRTEEVEGSRKLLSTKDAEIKRLGEALKTTSDANKKVVLERDEAMKQAHTASLGLYLERKIVGNPKASAIRVKFKEMATKSKDSVDALVEAFRSAPSSRGSDFSRIRGRLASAPRASTTLVEESIRDTGIEPTAKKIQVLEGVNMDADDINRLAGVK